MLSVVAGASAASGDVMQNGSFEESLAGWTAFGGSAALARDGVVGTSAAKVSGTTSRFGIYTDYWPVTGAAAGDVYSSTAWFRSDQPGSTACLRVREWDSGGAQVVDFQDACLTLQSGWVQVSVSYTVRTAGDRLEAYVFENGSSGKTFEVDGVALANGGGASAPPPPAPAPAPDTTIASGPASTTSDTSASFTFTSNVSNATFQCALDGAAFAACSSPKSYSGLSVASHTFQVRAVDGSGTVDPSPGSQTWTVQAPPPPAPAPASGDTMQNGSFEGSLSGWTAFGGAAALANDGKVGSSAAKITATTARFGIYTDYWPVSSATAGDVYTSTAWFRSDQPGYTVCLRVREWDASGSTVVDYRDACQTLTAGWAQATVSYTVQTGGDLLEAYVFENGANRASFEVDAVTLANGTAAPAPTPVSGDPVLVTAGDIQANCTSSAAPQTADLAASLGASVYMALGDETDDGTSSRLSSCFSPSWGRFGSLLYPAAGNHDYDQPNAAPYFSYFGSRAGDPAQGWYSFDVGSWHVVVLNSNCSQVGGCTSSSAQVAWLQNDLAAHRTTCTLAAFHHPLFTSVPEPYGNDASPLALWQALYAGGADVILNAHSHSYERFAPQAPDATVDTARGIREFIVGTGGAEPDGSRAGAAKNSEAWNGTTSGVLKLVLRSTGYDWSYLSAGNSWSDSGSAACHQ